MTATTSSFETSCKDEGVGGPGAAARQLLLLGLGNDLLCDDAIGLRVAEAARPLLVGLPNVEVAGTCEMGLALLDLVIGFEKLVLVDAVQTGRATAGTVHELDGADLGSLPLVSPHFLGVGEVLALGRKLGLIVPEEVLVFAVEVADPFTVSTRMSPALEAVLPGITHKVVLVARDRAAKLRAPPCVA